ncbi:hypothetical protein [Methylorubrum extorquens]|jgi:hypothetical protein|uniref:Uncharacterized protein n=1 Tax=Methylorubrum extorquens TaxID=408 RepID=A0AAX3WMT5_METEX|nr:hypothetical protein [Methylorubrum extorquens]WHQ72882.1 hypothetical protein KEC54_28460 [Methylorubrum extorquens]
MPCTLPAYADLIARALSTEGGHLAVGRGGFTLWSGRGCCLSGCDETEILTACCAAGLAVIDSRPVPFEQRSHLAVSGPMIAVGEPPDPPPHHGLSSASLAVVAEAYRAAGAAVFNLEATERGVTR